MLQLPRDEEGLAVLHPWNYFLVAQLQQVGGWEVSNDTASYSSRAILACTPHMSLIQALEADSWGVSVPRQS